MLIKNLEKLRKRTLRETIYEEVVRLIVSGELPSGNSVLIESLARFALQIQLCGTVANTSSEFGERAARRVSRPRPHQPNAGGHTRALSQRDGVVSMSKETQRSLEMRFSTGATMSDTEASISGGGAQVAAAVDPHWLTALAGAVVGHAGGAPGGGSDLAAFASVCLGYRAAPGSRLGRCWCRG
jgi:hypothetical protein